jgi:hypothetical protein
LTVLISGHEHSEFNAFKIKNAAQIKEQIEQLQGEIRHITFKTVKGTNTSTLNAAGIASIRAAQNPRWAKVKAAKPKAKAKPGSGHAHTMSAPGGAKVAAAARARWAKFRAARKK